jgi:predicted anti-sigma-YlaC factor YlaD
VEPRIVPGSGADCERMRRLTSLRLDDELSEPEQQKLTRHLNHCEACREFAISLATLTHALRHSAPRGRSRTVASSVIGHLELRGFLT